MELLRLWILLLCAAATLTTNVVNANINETVDIQEEEIGCDVDSHETVDIREEEINQQNEISDVISSKVMIHYVFSTEHLSK